MIGTLSISLIKRMGELRTKIEELYWGNGCGGN